MIGNVHFRLLVDIEVEKLIHISIKDILNKCLKLRIYNRKKKLLILFF